MFSSHDVCLSSSSSSCPNYICSFYQNIFIFFSPFRIWDFAFSPAFRIFSWILNRLKSYILAEFTRDIDDNMKGKVLKETSFLWASLIYQSIQVSLNSRYCLCDVFQLITEAWIHSIQRNFSNFYYEPRTNKVFNDSLKTTSSNIHTVKDQRVPASFVSPISLQNSNKLCDAASWGVKRVIKHSAERFNRKFLMLTPSRLNEDMLEFRSPFSTFYSAKRTLEGVYHPNISRKWVSVDGFDLRG